MTRNVWQVRGRHRYARTHRYSTFAAAMSAAYTLCMARRCEVTVSIEGESVARVTWCIGAGYALAHFVDAEVRS